MPARLPARILIVEDTLQFVDLVRLALRHLNADIQHVEYASDALSAIERFQPDLVLLDIGLPDMDGWHLLEALREQPTLTDKEPLVLVMTAYADAANRLIGKLQRVDGYLTKPCTVQEIRLAVVSVLQLLDTANLSDPRA